MVEYVISVVVLTSVVGLLGYLSYPSFSERTLRFAASVLIIYAVVVPVLGLAAHAGESLSDIIDKIRDEGQGGLETDYIDVAEDAMADGIREAIAAKFNMDAENIRVSVEGLDFESMRAARIRVVLAGKDALGDFRRVEEYTKSLGLGECEVELDFG
ncbi:MAG: hypothetical protein J6V09_04645 [Clostridia bacterium]|nr:hypothetical protein [Clostridia bacterium]